MLRAVLIDDEENALNGLSQLLKDFVTVPVKVVGMARNLDEGIRIINSTFPDVVFLDIDMPGKTGLEIYDHFTKPDFRIIFVTAYNQYAIAALKNSPSDYLLKPVSFIELREALKKVEAEIGREQHVRELEDKVSQVAASGIDGQNILFEVSTGFIIENTKNIEYCHAEQAYSTIVTNTGKEIVVSKPLKALQEQLPPNQFLRSHKSYLVNIHYIRKFLKANESILLMKSGKKIPVSVRKSPNIVRTIKQMLES